MSDTINIGGIMVTIGGTSDQLKSQLTQVQKMFTDLQSKGGDAMSGLSIKSIAAALGIGLAFDKVKDAIEDTINAADDLGKAAQRLGIAVPALAKLEAAAVQADLSIDDLSTSLRILSQRISETDPGSQGALLFKTLGINVKDATGQIKDSGTILLEIADKFSTYRDGVNKTSLAMQLFGRQGASMIPLLNQGRDAIEAAGKAAQDAGITIDQDLVDASHKFNDTWTDLKQNLQGGLNQLTKELLPGLQAIADTLKDATDKGTGFKVIMDDVTTVFKSLISLATVTSATVMVVGESFKGTALAAYDAVRGDFNNATLDMMQASMSIQGTWQQSSNIMQKIWGVDIPNAVRAGVDQVNAITGSVKLPDFSGGLGNALQRDAPKPLTSDDISKQLYAISQGTEDATAKIAQLNKMFDSGLITLQTYDSAVSQALQAVTQLGQFNLDDIIGDSTQSYVTKVNALNDAWKRGIITFQQYKQNMKSVADENETNMNTILSTTGSTLTQLFQQSKGAAIANASINTFEGITSALKLPFPLNWVQASLVAAAGFAQVQNIRSQTQNGGGSTSSATSSAAASATGGSAPAAALTPQQTLNVVGINANSLFTGDQVRNIAQTLIDYQKDGGRVILD